MALLLTIKKGDRLMMIAYKPFYKVIILQVDVFETTIIDERHFPDRLAARSYANQYRQKKQIIALIIHM